MARATARLAKGRRNQPRIDRGASRLPDAVEGELIRLLSTQQRPEMSAVARQLRDFAASAGVSAPSRATLYNALPRVPMPEYAWDALPAEVQESLYNWRAEGEATPATVSADQVVFFAFNYGAPRALTFASGLPWLSLWRAYRRPGWRPKSRALLAAVMKYRGI